jgi:phosphoglycerate dehydrogenase-like enzyme
VTGWGSPRLPLGALEEEKSSLRYVCHLTGEMRRCVPLEYIRNDRVVITNWGSAIAGFVAETALALILACSRRLRRHFEAMITRGGWRGDVLPSGSLFNKRIGLYGLGNIARQLIELLSPFNPVLSYYDPYAEGDILGKMKRAEDLADLFEHNDIVSIHAAQTPETIGSVNRRILELLPDNAILVNTARGAIMNEKDLADVLAHKNLWVGLDVFTEEPLHAESTLRTSDRIVLTPHIGGKTGTDQMDAIARVALRNIRDFIAGKPLQFVITEREYDKMT